MIRSRWNLLGDLVIGILVQEHDGTLNKVVWCIDQYVTISVAIAGWLSVRL